MDPHSAQPSSSPTSLLVKHRHYLTANEHHGWQAALLSTPLQLSYSMDITLDEATQLQQDIAKSYLAPVFRKAQKGSSLVAPLNAVKQERENHLGGSGSGAGTMVDTGGSTETAIMLSDNEDESCVDDAVGAAADTVLPTCKSAPATALLQSGGGHRTFVETGLHALDDALLGGIPVGFITELVGTAGCGKTTLAMRIAAFSIIEQSIDIPALRDSLGISKPSCSERGGDVSFWLRDRAAVSDINSTHRPKQPPLHDSVLWLDGDLRFNPHAFGMVLMEELEKQLHMPNESKAQLHGWSSAEHQTFVEQEVIPVLMDRILVWTPTPKATTAARCAGIHSPNNPTSKSSLLAVLENQQELELLLIEHHCRLLIVDSLATCVKRSFSGHPSESTQRHDAVAKLCSLCKVIGETLHVATVVVNHASSSSSSSGFSGAVSAGAGDVGDAGTAMMGNTFHHAVNTRLNVLGYSVSTPLAQGGGSGSGGGVAIKIAKSPVAPPLKLTV